MTISHEARTWLTDRLTELGGSGSASDLTQQWSDELRRAADTMAADGALTIVGDRWTVQREQVPSRPGRWTEDEIAVAVNAYVTMLRAEHGGQPVHRRGATAKVVEQTARTQTIVEAMFANISAVVQEHGFDYLGAYPPKSNVPAGVRAAVDAALKA